MKTAEEQIELFEAAGRLISALAKKGVVTLQDFLDRATRRFGQAFVDNMRPVFEAEWAKAFPAQERPQEAQEEAPAEKGPKVEPKAAKSPRKGEEGIGRSAGITSIKNAVVDDLRGIRGLDPMVNFPKETFEEWVETAHSRMRAEDTWIPLLAQELRDEPRAVDEIEHAGLQLYYRQLYNKLGPMLAKVREAQAAGDSARAARAMTEAVSLQGILGEFERATKASGWKAGKALAARKIELAEDYSIEGLIRKAILDMKGAAIGPKEMAYMENLAKTVERLQTEIAKQTARAEAAERAKRVEVEIKKVRKPRRKDELAILDGMTPEEFSLEALQARADRLGIYTGGRSRPRLAYLIDKVEANIKAFAEQQGIPYRVFLEGIDQTRERVWAWSGQREHIPYGAADVLQFVGVDQHQHVHGQRSDLHLSVAGAGVVRRHISGVWDQRDSHQRRDGEHGRLVAGVGDGDAVSARC